MSVAITDALLCPCCGELSLRLEQHSGTGLVKEIRLRCTRCRRAVRPVREGPAAFQGAEEGGLFTPPPDLPETPDPKWWWLGCVLLDDGSYHPVALAGTLAGCWAALDGWPGVPARLCLPVLPEAAK